MPAPPSAALRQAEQHSRSLVVQAIDEVKSGAASFIEGKAHPMTAEQAARAVKADAVRFLAKLGLSTWRLEQKRESHKRAEGRPLQ